MVIALADLAAEVGGQAVGAATITGATHDSRAVRPGDIYLAVPGAHVHGADFIPQARAAGAVAVVVDAAHADIDVPRLVVADVRASMGPVAAAVHGHPERDLAVIGVTGTNGKTTVTLMVEHILRHSGATVGVIGTLGARIAGHEVPGVRTTPEATDTYALFAHMRAAGVTHVAMEVSSHGLALHRVSGIQFAVAAFTNLSQDHLDFHGSMSAYFEAKASLFEHADRMVINADGEWGARLAERYPQADVVGRDWLIEGFSQTAARGSVFTLAGSDTQTVSLPLLGGFNAENAAVAVLAARAVGVSLTVSADALASFPGVPGRMERVSRGDSVVVVDYAHTPDAVARVLAVLDEVTAGSLITVMGCGGDRDPGKRPEMGRVASQVSDVVVVTDDNPRSENPAEIRAAIIAGATDGRARVVEIGDRREAIRYALSVAAPGDLVAVLGKGHEQGQETAGVVLPFDDRDVVRQESARA